MFFRADLRLIIMQICSWAPHAVISVPKLHFSEVLRHVSLEFEYEIAGSLMLQPPLRLHEGGALSKVNKMINTIILLVIIIHSTKYIYFAWILNLLKPTGHVMHQQFNIQQLYVLPTLYLYVFLFIWEQTATCATYSINWLVFITEMKSVYCAVRTGYLNKAVCGSYLKG